MRLMSDGVFGWLVTMMLVGGAGRLCLGQGIIDLPADLVENGAKVTGLKTGLAYCEGPAFDKNGNLYFSEMSSPQAKIWKVTPDGAATVARTGSFFNGIECDPQGRLVFCERDKITRMNESGAIETISKSGDNGCDLNDVNDISIATNGAMFFTNHSSGRTLFYRSPAGVLSKNAGYEVPNGVEWIEEKKFLYLCLTDGNKVITQSVGADGSVSNKKDFVSISTPDGITLDERYNVYVASYLEGKIRVFDSTGKALGSITLQGESNPAGNASNCIFGGPENKTLIITGDGGAYKVPMKVGGRKKGGNAPVVIPPQHCHGSDLSGGVAGVCSGAGYYDLFGRCAGIRDRSPAASGMYIVRGIGGRVFSEIKVQRNARAAR